MDVHINLNGTEYISRESYNLLHDEFEAFKKDVVLRNTLIKSDEKNVKPYILDPANVMATGIVIQLDNDFVKMLGFDMTFKLLSNDVDDLITVDGHNKFFKLPDHSKYSVEYLKRAKKIALAVIGRSVLQLYQGWSVKKKALIKDYPVMFRSEDLCFILAPIIEND